MTKSKDDFKILERYGEFEKLVRKAEEFIVKSGVPVVNAVRKQESTERPDFKAKLQDDARQNAEKCYNLLSYKNKYFPRFKIKNKILCDRNDNHKISKYDIIMQFCRELQNYQAMPKAIDYINYSYDVKNNNIEINTDDNKIFVAIKKFLKDKTDDYFCEIQKEKKENLDNVDIKFGKNKNKSLIPLTYNFDLYKFMRNELKFKESSEIKIENDEICFLLQTSQKCKYTQTKEDIEKNINNDKKFDFYVDRYKRNGNGYSKGDKKGYLYSQAWYKYTRGLMDVLIQIHLINQLKTNYKDYVKFVTDICTTIESDSSELEKFIDDEKEFNRQFKKIENTVRNFNGKNNKTYKNDKVDNEESTEDNDDGKNNNLIFYLGDTLTYDFLKELACENLVKADIHIKELFNKVIYKKDREEEISNEKLITRNFIQLCNMYREDYGKIYTPFYIDKMFWLCCTGNFYADGITITKMTRNNFIEFAAYKPVSYN